MKQTRGSERAASIGGSQGAERAASTAMVGLKPESLKADWGGRCTEAICITDPIPLLSYKRNFYFNGGNSSLWVKGGHGSKFKRFKTERTRKTENRAKNRETEPSKATRPVLWTTRLTQPRGKHEHPVNSCARQPTHWVYRWPSLIETGESRTHDQSYGNVETLPLGHQEMFRRYKAENPKEITVEYEKGV
ncbi:hypothetical protein LXL04_011713 [Taraxacum kok-saghyz]